MQIAVIIDVNIIQEFIVAAVSMRSTQAEVSGLVDTIPSNGVIERITNGIKGVAQKIKQIVIDFFQYIYSFFRSGEATVAEQLPLVSEAVNPVGLSQRVKKFVICTGIFAIVAAGAYVAYNWGQELREPIDEKRLLLEDTFCIDSQSHPLNQFCEPDAIQLLAPAIKVSNSACHQMVEDFYPYTSIEVECTESFDKHQKPITVCEIEGELGDVPEAVVGNMLDLWIKTDERMKLAFSQIKGTLENLGEMSSKLRSNLASCSELLSKGVNSPSNGMHYKTSYSY